MIKIKFDKAVKTSLSPTAIFLKFEGEHFRENLDKIKGFWNRVYLGPPLYSWEVPYTCFEEIKLLFKGEEVVFYNEPPKAEVVTEDQILEGLDFNRIQLI